MHIFTYSLLLGGALLGGCTIHNDLLTAGEQDDAASGSSNQTSGGTMASDPTGTAADAETTGTSAGDDTGPVTGASEATGSETGRSQDTDTDTDTDGGQDTGEAAPDGYEHVQFLGWSDGLIGVAHREAPCGNCGAHVDYKAMLIRVDPDTNQRTKFGEAEGSVSASDLVVAGDGSIFVSGYRPGSDMDSPGTGLLFKFSPDGQQLWKRQLESGWAVDLAFRGEELLSVELGTQVRGRSQDDGATLWTIDGLGAPSLVVADSDDTLYVAGRSTLFQIPEFEYTWYVRKYAADRTLLWEDVRPPVGDSSVAADGLVLDEAGGLIVAEHENGKPRIFHKYAPDGTELWAKSNPDIASSTLEQLVARPGGGVIAVGRNFGGSTVALDPEGATVWADLHTPPDVEGHQNLSALVVDDQLFVSGAGYNPPAGPHAGWILQFTP